MGWTWYYATEWKNGKIDRKRECEKQFEYANSPYKVLKSSMVGATWYAAIQKDDIVFAAVFSTSTNGWDFGYKDMDETCGPYYYDCPLSILKLLTPTENNNANNWRELCKLNIEKKKKQVKLSSLEVGTIIEAECPCDTSACKKGKIVKLQKIDNWGSIYWSDGCYRWTRPLMTLIQENGFKILKEGE